MKVRNETDLCLAHQCAPVLAGIKTSNIFMAKGMEEKQLEEIFRDTPLNCRRICQDMYLIYWPDRMQRELTNREIQCFLRLYGYRIFWTQAVLERLSGRMERYKKGSRNSLMNWVFSLVIPWRMCGDLSIIRERTIFTVVIGKYMAT